MIACNIEQGGRDRFSVSCVWLRAMTSEAKGVKPATNGVDLRQLPPPPASRLHTKGPWLGIALALAATINLLFGCALN